MSKEIRLLLSTTTILLLLLPPLLSGCARAKPYYFNDSDKIYTNSAKTGVCSGVEFDCVVMSQGKYRELTTVPENR